MASNEEVIKALKALEQRICDNGLAGGCPEVRSLRTELVAHIATQSEINQRTKEVILEVYGNGKPGLRQDMQAVKHDVRDLREDVTRGFGELKEAVKSEREARKDEDDKDERKIEEKVLTWKWLREKVTVPLIMVALFFLVEHGLKILFP